MQYITTSGIKVNQTLAAFELPESTSVEKSKKMIIKFYGYSVLKIVITFVMNSNTNT